MHMGNIGNRHDPGRSHRSVDTKCLVKSQFTNTEFFIKLYHIIHELFRGLCFCQFLRQCTDPVTDPFIKDLAAFIDILIIGDQTAVHRRINLLQFFQIKVIQLFKDFKIMHRECINSAFHRTYDLTGRTERIFMIDQQIGQIIMPQVSRKPVGSCHLYQLMNTCKILPVLSVEYLRMRDIFHQHGHLLQQFSLFKITI